MKRCFLIFCLPFAFCSLSSGCKSPNYKLESELRHRDNDIDYLRTELSRSKTYNKAMEMELRASRGEVPLGTPYDPMAKVYPLKTITLGRQTGGVDLDGQPGEEALQVIIEPKDAEGHTVKVPANVLIQVIEISTEGLKTPLSTWQISSDELSKSWRNGLLTTGYALSMQWKLWPNSDKLRVQVQFKLDDGRLFEAEKDFVLKMPPAYLRKTPAIETQVAPPTSNMLIPMPGLIPAPAKSTNNIPLPTPMKEPLPPLPAPMPNNIPLPNPMKEPLPPLPAPKPEPNTNSNPLPKPTVDPTKDALPPLPEPMPVPGTSPMKNTGSKEVPLLPPPPPLTPNPVPFPSEKLGLLNQGPNLLIPPGDNSPLPESMVSAGIWKSVNTNLIVPTAQILKPTKSN